jgi:hypothetical protein
MQEASVADPGRPGVEFVDALIELSTEPLILLRQND